jgi:hypothetical protein
MAAGINVLPWLTLLTVPIGPYMLFQALAHSTNRSCSGTAACGRSAGKMMQRDRSQADASRKP